MRRGTYKLYTQQDTDTRIRLYGSRIYNARKLSDTHDHAFCHGQIRSETEGI